MTIEFKLPDVGEGVADGEIVQWLVSAGDRVKEHQAVVEVMTDKATVEIPSPADGQISALLAEAGDVVPVGSVIFTLETEGGATVAEPALAAASASGGTAVASAPPAAPPAIKTTTGKVLAVPSARRVARDLGVDLDRVAGSGRHGVVRRADVEAFHSSGAAPASAAPTPAPIQGSGGETRTPFRGVRRKIAEAMVRSAFTAPHFTVIEEVDVTDLVALRGRAKALGAAEGVKVTYMPFIMKATALCLARFPMLNGTLDEETNELVNFHYSNLGIATDTPNGLLVPVIKAVEQKGVLALARELAELAERTRAGKVKPDELVGSTFSITNAGNIGGIMATPIINFPDIAILGVHRLMKKPGVVAGPDGDRIEVRQYMNFSISVDHRLADGADGARFLAYFRTLLEDPGLLSL
ncbi:MAG TPA: 2-oxo acid dehydrogenase subunit E2 [Planctomycetes bacterium]|jgi:pyruvate dehydrogenase E2 component (dihydrolipoamide acetyltransferase)|nr:2-oxo acid dehydrogenase subunit E2 [Planctomycetota bacterium]HIL51042.1 2-oxo acid dehydrogenase subunit E2 [Planctomycetota bacterium]